MTDWRLASPANRLVLHSHTKINQTAKYSQQTQLLGARNGRRVPVGTFKTSEFNSRMWNPQRLMCINQTLLSLPMLSPLLLMDASYSRVSTNHSAFSLTVANERGAKTRQPIRCVHNYVSSWWVCPRHHNRTAVMWTAEQPAVHRLSL